MAGLIERLSDFRLIDPSFDGDRELGKFLGFNNPKGSIAPKAQTTSTENAPDELTLKMIQYLKHEIDEEPELDTGTP